MSAARGACIALVSCLVLVSAPAVGQATTRSGDPAAGLPGAPSHVHAIAGDNSVTVTWCPPPTGQGSVVSYTVTSSSGQTTTAPVPNDWVIVEG